MTHMYYADLTVNYADGSFGAKRFEAITMDAAQKQADKKVKEIIQTSKFAKQMDADKTFEVTSFRVKSGVVDV